MANEVYLPEGFFVTTLSADLTATETTIPLTAVPSDVTKGYLIVEPASTTKREVIHFTSVGTNTVTAADDPTDASDATGRGCKGSIAAGGLTTHDQGATVIIAASYQYWKRLYDILAIGHSMSDGTHNASIALTTPKITTSINDSNGNEVIKTPATASAVNEITVTNAAANGTPTISATGGDDNVSLNLVSKGSGTIQQNGVAITRLASKIIVATRDLTAASGDVSYTGVGFIPTAIIAFTSIGGALGNSVGAADSSRTVKSLGWDTNAITYMQDVVVSVATATGGTSQKAIVKSYDADGFTLTWTKTGSPTGNANLTFLCFK